MKPLIIVASKIIDASPADVYAVMSDYRVSHPAILPKPYFSELAVLYGGQGAGTLIEVHMNVLGAKRVFHQVSAEPEPGRMLLETDAAADVTTSFTVDPIDNGNRSQVTIATESRLSLGILGFFERLCNPLIIRHIYRQELEQLDKYVRRSL